jgi:putative transposase
MALRGKKHGPKLPARRLTLRVYPTPAQNRVLNDFSELHRQLYNAALQERIGAYKVGQPVDFAGQQKSLTQIRAESPEYKAIGRRAAKLTLERLDRAYSAFFRRAKAGQTPGFPRFKGKARWPGFSLNAGEGYQYAPKITANGRWFNGRLGLSGIGSLRVRGKARMGGEVLGVDMCHRQGQWYASIIVQGIPKRTRGSKVAGIDWGVETYATLAHGAGQYQAVANDRLYQAQEAAAKDKCRALSKAQRGKKSNNAHKKRRAVARQYAKLANRRKDRAHKLAARLVAQHRLIAMEKLQIANMTASAKGTVEKPGKKVAQKAGLNREILDTAPGMLMGMIRYKAAEAGCELILINTRKHKPSQTCPACGVVKKKALSERKHACGCGFAASRDEASALHVLNIALRERFGPVGPLEIAPETPSRAA